MAVNGRRAFKFGTELEQDLVLLLVCSEFGYGQSGPNDLGSRLENDENPGNPNLTFSNNRIGGWSNTSM